MRFPDPISLAHALHALTASAAYSDMLYKLPSIWMFYFQMYTSWSPYGLLKESKHSLGRIFYCEMRIITNNNESYLIIVLLTV